MLASASPAHAPVARAVGQRLLDNAPLTGTGAFTGTTFRRTTCCLYYQVPGGGYCGDCVLLGRGRGRQ
jgi:ferric iron reductase protein FhuF